MEPGNKKVYVIGHRNPDTDSICAAISYAYLKSAASEMECVACRAGEINRETEYALNYFGVQPPRLITDVSPQVGDIDIRKEEPIDQETSLKDAWSMMRDRVIDTLVITDQDRELQGVITIKDIATANMGNFDRSTLAKAKTSYKNLVSTLDGTLVVGDENGRVEKGRLHVNGGTTESMEKVVEPGDIVLLSNRYESQFCAIELGASILIICMDAQVPKTILRLAEERNVAIIRTPYDTYEASRLISQAAPVRHYMTTQNLLTFSVHTPVENARKIMAQVRHRYFPILDNDGKYCGVISRRNLLNLHPKQLILVDHNERTQAVEGYERADILEIIDHHRLGSLETSGPVFFRNMPVGCTCTIIFQMFLENMVEIPKDIAGVMLSAILSDTLMFRSPTCTPQDEQAATALANIAQVDMEAYAQQMFEAGGNLEGKSPEEVFLQDFKIFTSGEDRFGVGQGSYMTRKNREAAQDLLRSYLPIAMQKQNVPLLFYMFTDVRDTVTYLMIAGSGAKDVVEDAFGQVEWQDDLAILPGVVSRKKQLIPAILKVFEQT